MAPVGTRRSCSPPLALPDKAPACRVAAVEVGTALGPGMQVADWDTVVAPTFRSVKGRIVYSIHGSQGSIGE